MTTTINAQATNGLLTTADGSGIVKLQSNGVATNSLVWINFNGVSGSVTTRSSYNISSLTRNSTGNYTLSFTNSLSDANYACICSGLRDDRAQPQIAGPIGTPSTSSINVGFENDAGSFIDSISYSVAIFGN